MTQDIYSVVIKRQSNPSIQKYSRPSYDFM